VIRITGAWARLRLKLWQIAILGLFLAVFLPIIQTQVWGGDWSQYSNEAIVEAIGKAENSVKYPFGIKSIDTKSDVKYARKICYNSVRNGRRRWIVADKPDDLIIFIGKRYCPPSAHSLNKNWTRNVKYFLENNAKNKN